MCECDFHGSLTFEIGRALMRVFSVSLTLVTSYCASEGREGVGWLCLNDTCGNLGYVTMTTWQCVCVFRWMYLGHNYKMVCYVCSDSPQVRTSVGKASVGGMLSLAISLESTAGAPCTY